LNEGVAEKRIDVVEGGEVKQQEIDLEKGSMEL
jgi:hypothetical protein